MSYTMYTPLNVWLDPASVTDVVAYIQNYLSENTIYSEEEIEELIHDYLIAHPELIGGVQSVNGKTGTVVLSASDINTANNVTIESVLSSLSSQISSIAASVATNTANITSLTGRVSTAETDLSALNSSFDSALSPTQAENNLCTGFVRGKYWIAWNDGAPVTLTDNANYMAATVPLNGEQYISLNQSWDGNSYSFFADADNKRIALMRDCIFDNINYVYTVPQNAKYAYISQNVQQGGYSDNWLNTIGIVVLARNTSIINYSVDDYPYGGIAGVHYCADDLVIAEQGYKRIGDLKSQMVFTCKKDGTGDFDSFVECVNEAVKYTDSIVYVGAGEWDIIEELGSSYMAVVSSSSETWGLVLKNNVHIIGTSKTIIKAQNATGSTNFNNIKQYFSVFNSGGNGGFTIENLTISDENIRYSVHDDLGGSGSTPYINKYINCTMIHKNGRYSDCIGGGIGENANIEIRGCYFEGETGNPRIVYYHGNNNQNVTNAQATIIVCDNYFAQDGTFRLTNYGNSTTISKAYVSNNSFGTAPSVTDGSSPSPIIVNMELIEWNNIVRT